MNGGLLQSDVQAQMIRRIDEMIVPGRMIECHVAILYGDARIDKDVVDDAGPTFPLAFGHQPDHLQAGPPRRVARAAAAK